MGVYNTYDRRQLVSYLLYRVFLDKYLNCIWFQMRLFLLVFTQIYNTAISNCTYLTSIRPVSSKDVFCCLCFTDIIILLEALWYYYWKGFHLFILIFQILWLVELFCNSIFHDLILTLPNISMINIIMLGVCKAVSVHYVVLYWDHLSRIIGT